MSRIRGLELLFNLEKKQLKCREDCIVAAVHCILINENMQCVGTGETWSDSDWLNTTELLPKDWNSDPNAYTLRYISKDNQLRVLVKITKVEHILQVHVVMNEDAIEIASYQVDNFTSEDYNEYSSTYKNLESLAESLHVVMQKLKCNQQKMSSSKQKSKHSYSGSSLPSPPSRPTANLGRQQDPYLYRFPEVGGRDVSTTGNASGGMWLDPSGIGVPPRPTVPSTICKGSVPPGAKCDPSTPLDPDSKKPDSKE